MTTTSAGVKFDGWVAQARALGLDVEITVNSDDGVLQSVSARISRPRVEEHNMLDVVRNQEVVSLHAVRCGGGRWSNSAGRYGFGLGYRRFERLHSVSYWLSGMAESG